MKISPFLGAPRRNALQILCSCVQFASSSFYCPMVRMVNFMQFVSCCPRNDDLDIVHIQVGHGVVVAVKERVYLLT